MKTRYLLFFPLVAGLLYFISITGSGCAQIGAPTGGPRDSLPPVLINANPKLFATNFTSDKIVLTFDEYIDVQEVQNNVLVSPFPKITPTVDFKLKQVTVKLKDTLLPNTTYAINFGNAIRDNNEANPYRNFTYVFSTGSTIDSLQAKGKVIIAETGKTDSTIIAMLYRNVDDSAVQKRKPDYISKLDAKGQFRFTNLSGGKYRLYALKDGDGGKTYNSKIELFAFAPTDIEVADSTAPIVMYAYAEEKEKEKPAAPAAANPRTAQADKRLRITTNLAGNFQELISDLVLTVNRPLKVFDPQKITLSDTNYNKINAAITLDSTARNIRIKTPWAESMHYFLVIDTSALADSAGTRLAKVDTIRLAAKKESEYGTLLLRFSGLDTSRHPVLQFVKSEEVIKSVPIVSAEWRDRLFVPGEYEIRILYDDNNNGIWDPGNYALKKQPEKAITVDTRLLIKANWDNEREVKLLPIE
ncbi:MAG: Ig-like domain-containing protein [Ferruginibacter sp.]|nr:Ig-like domain-containing protein [Ferruginibacter sp.]